MGVSLHFARRAWHRQNLCNPSFSHVLVRPRPEESHCNARSARLRRAAKHNNCQRRVQRTPEKGVGARLLHLGLVRRLRAVHGDEAVPERRVVLRALEGRHVEGRQQLLGALQRWGRALGVEVQGVWGV